MIYRSIVFFICWTVICGQPPPAPSEINVGVLNDQARKFIEIYGLATQLMNFGGSIINNAKDVYDAASPSTKFRYSENGVFNDFIWPKLQGFNKNAINKSPSYPPSDYGAGALGATSSQVQSARQSGIETLLNTFLGPTFFGQTTSAPSIDLVNFFKPSYQIEDYQSKGGSNIDRLISMLTSSGARRAAPEPESQNFLQNLFGKR